MVLLHGSWIHPSLTLQDSQALSAHEPTAANSVFFLWGETWRSSTAPITPFSPAPPHPFCLSVDELFDALRSLHGAKFLTLPSALQDVLQKRTQDRKRNDGAEEWWQVRSLSLLCNWTDTGVVPLHSGAEPSEEVCLYPLQVSGLCFSAAVATEFLLAIPLNADLQAEDPLGTDLRYWSHVSRWSLDLLVRSKVLPSLQKDQDGSIYAYWQPLLDSALDQARLRQMQAQMPLVCQCCVGASTDDKEQPPALALPTPSKPILLASLQQLVDQQVRKILGGESSSVAVLTKMQDKSLSEWLSALERPTGELRLKGESGNLLLSAFATWTKSLDLAQTQQKAFRAVFSLAPPLPSSQTWTVSYGLQATDAPTCWVSAEQIWATPSPSLSVQGRTLEHPQETLLAGLGLASRVYPAIEESLQTARPTQHTITPLQAYEFLKAVTWRLEDSGFGVIVPPKLANR